MSKRNKFQYGIEIMINAAKSRKKEYELFKVAATNKEQLTHVYFFRAKIQECGLFISGLSNLVKAENKRRDKIEKFGEKKIGRPKKHSLSIKDINKYQYL